MKVERKRQSLLSASESYEKDKKTDKTRFYRDAVGNGDQQFQLDCECRRIVGRVISPTMQKKKDCEQQPFFFLLFRLFHLILSGFGIWALIFFKE